MERFDSKLDAATRSHQRLAADAAIRAVDIDELRLLSEASVAPEHAKGGSAVDVARRVLVSEVACAFRLPERTAETLIEASRSLVHKLPATLRALGVGAISYQHAQVIIDEASTLTTEVAAAFEAEVLPAGERQTAAQLRRTARIARERIDVDSIKQRTSRSVANRAVFFEPAHDGMAWLSAYLPAAQAMAIFNRVTNIAASLQGSGEDRTLTQLRADVLSDLVLDRDQPSGSGAAGEGSTTGGIKADVCLLVPVLSLLGNDDEPATLEGYGPISIDAARDLVGDAKSFIRILTHPETGALLSVGHDRYGAPKDLRTVLRLRDVTCRFPGCNRPAERTDLDHTLDWAKHGPTQLDNLSCLCGPHHALKHASAWAVTQSDDGTGTLGWLSPSGRMYTTEPGNRIGMDPPHPVAPEELEGEPPPVADDPPPEAEVPPF